MRFNNCCARTGIRTPKYTNWEVNIQQSLILNCEFISSFYCTLKSRGGSAISRAALWDDVVSHYAELLARSETWVVDAEASQTFQWCCVGSSDVVFGKDFGSFWFPFEWNFLASPLNFGNFLSSPYHNFFPLATQNMEVNEVF